MRFLTAVALALVMLWVRRLIRGVSRYRSGRVPLNISLVVLLCASAACGKSRLLVGPPGLSPQDTAAAVLPSADNLGSVVVVNVQNRKPAQSLLGYDLALGGEEVATFLYQVEPQFGCAIRDLLHETLRDRGGQASSLGSQALINTMGGGSCFELAPRQWEQFVLGGDVPLSLELLDFTYNTKSSPFHSKRCNSEAHLRWRIDVPGTTTPRFVKETMSSFEGGCRNTITDGLSGSVRVGFLQLLADSEFLRHMKALRGTAAPRAQVVAAEADRRASLEPTQDERGMLELYEDRERQLLALISPEYDERHAKALYLSCLGGAMRSGNTATTQDCIRQLEELRNQQAARRRPVEQELFEFRQDKLELEGRIRLARASTNNPPQPPAQAVAKPSPPNEVRVVTPSASCAYTSSSSALEDVRSCAEQGDAAAQFYLGFRYAEGEGVPEDDAEAARWYRLAAEQGDEFAQTNLGVMYDNGEGVPEDDAEAVRWFRLAAEQGHAQAQSNLGLMYALGESVPADDVLAYMWFNLAAAQGDEVAQDGKDLIEEDMTREQIAEAQRMSREWLEAHPPGN
jgi:hypothetical protein